MILYVCSPSYVPYVLHGWQHFFHPSTKHVHVPRSRNYTQSFFSVCIPSIVPYILHRWQHFFSQAQASASQFFTPAHSMYQEVEVILNYSFLSAVAVIRVPTGYGKHGKWLKKIPCMEKSWNLKINEKIMEFWHEIAFWMSISHKFFSLASLALHFQKHQVFIFKQSNPNHLFFIIKHILNNWTHVIIDYSLPVISVSFR